MPKRRSSDDTGQWVQIYSHLINLCKLAIDDGSGERKFGDWNA